MHAEVSLDETFRGTIGKFHHDVLDLVLAWESGGAAIGLLPVSACIKIWRAVIGLLHVAEIEMLLGITARRRVRRSHRVEAGHRGERFFRRCLCLEGFVTQRNDVASAPSRNLDLIFGRSRHCRAALFT